MLWTDIVMSIVGCVIVNQYIGIHLGFIVFLILLSGQLLCAVGGFVNSFWIFLLVRLIVGCVGTSINLFHVWWQRHHFHYVHWKMLLPVVCCGLRYNMYMKYHRSNNQLTSFS